MRTREEKRQENWKRAEKEQENRSSSGNARDAVEEKQQQGR